VQVVAVLAPELGHWKLGHTICLMALQQVVMLSQFVLFAIVRSSSHLLEEFGFVDKKPVIISLLLFSMICGPMDSLIGWLFNLLSRRCDAACSMCVPVSCSVPAFQCVCQFPALFQLALHDRLCSLASDPCAFCRYEFQADAFAVSLKQEDHLTEALKILDKENKSDFVVDRLYSQYHYSHPPLIERLRAIQAAGKKLV
jgi:STE24 endopeptidase